MKQRILSLFTLLLAAVLLTACNPDVPPVDVTGDGVSLHNISVDADRFIIPTPRSEAVYMDKYLPIAIWDVTEDGTKENMRLTFCDMESGKMIEQQYPLLGTDIPQGVMWLDDVFYLVAPTDTGYRGWTFSGAPEELTVISEVDSGVIESALDQYETLHVTSADGTLSACHKQRDVLGHGGVYLTDETGAGKYIAENVMMTESSSVGIQDIRVYSPARFWGNDTLVYTIGGVEWAIGYGFYDIKTGEKKEVENGRGILAVTDDCLYTYIVIDYAIMEVQKVLPDGTETVIAAADTATEELVPFFSENVVAMEHTGEACIIWYYEDMMDTASLRLRVYDGELTKVLLDADMSSTYAPMSDWAHYNGKILLFAPRG